MYDHVEVAVLSASGSAASNALSGAFRLHKITLHHADGAAVCAVSLFDAATATGTAKSALSTNLADGTTFQRYAEANFDPPVPFQVGISSTLTGTATYRLHVTRM